MPEKSLSSDELTAQAEPDASAAETAAPSRKRQADALKAGERAR